MGVFHVFKIVQMVPIVQNITYVYRISKLLRLNFALHLLENLPNSLRWSQQLVYNKFDLKKWESVL